MATKSDTKGTSASPDPSSGAFPDMTLGFFPKPDTAAVEQMTAASQAMFKNATEVQQELVGFLSRRMAEDMQAMQDMMSSRDPEEILSKQQAFVTKAIGDYFDESTKLMAKMADLGTNSK